jgi:hypothetical protein
MMISDWGVVLLGAAIVHCKRLDMSYWNTMALQAYIVKPMVESVPEE